MLILPSVSILQYLVILPIAFGRALNLQKGIFPAYLSFVKSLPATGIIFLNDLDNLVCCDMNIFVIESQRLVGGFSLQTYYVTLTRGTIVTL
jgi:hypothetical protein